jgi:hypothetical protein
MSAPWRITLFVPTDHRECSGPTILGKRHTNEPFCSAVGLGFFAFNRDWRAGVASVVVVVAGTVVVVVGTVVVGVVVVVVVVDAATNFTGR